MAKAPKTQKRIDARDWKTAAEFIKQEASEREGSERRKELVRVWDEVDRQVAMIPRPRVDADKSAPENAWLPNVELPLGATALEVLTSDARRLKFPKTTDWFTVSTELSDDYAARFDPRVPGQDMAPNLDQETADVLAKSSMDHFHRVMKFRESMDVLDVEAFKYGTYAARVEKVIMPKWTNDFRGLKSEKVMGPALIPIPIRSLLLDESPQAVMHDGLALSPAHIRHWFQRLDDVLLAAKTGGVDRGWITKNLGSLNALKDPKDHVKMYEWEGDLVLPRSGNDVFLPNVRVTVACGEDGPVVVRYREVKLPFRSIVHGTYQRDDIRSPYGVSPLMKGQPLQEAATEMYNRLIEVGSLSAAPPVTWDSEDTLMKAMGGPKIYPNAMWESSNPVAVIPQKIGDIGELLQAYLAILSQYEDLLGVTAPRKGAQTKSHTTAFAVDVENSRGLVRTDDFVTTQEEGFLTSVLHMEWEIARECMKSKTPIYVNSGGMEGFVRVDGDDLADVAVFNVQGSSGSFSKREAIQNKVAAFQLAGQLSQASAAQGGRSLNFDAAMIEVMQEVGDIPNAERFLTETKIVPTGAQGGAAPQGSGADVLEGQALPTDPVAAEAA